MKLLKKVEKHEMRIENDVKTKVCIVREESGQTDHDQVRLMDDDSIHEYE